MTTDYITKRLDGVLFSFYSKEEIRKLSVVEISNPNAFDSLNKPLKKGLYDPAMGISPYDKNSRCITCGMEGPNCSGHIGHIELAVPVYNPLTTKYMMRVLKSMCYKCHRLRIPAHRIEDWAVMLLLVKLGYVTEKSIYEQACSGRHVKANTSTAASDVDARSSGSLSTSISHNTSMNPSRKQSQHEEQNIHAYEDALLDTEAKKKQIKQRIKKMLNIKENPDFKITENNSTMLKAVRDIIQDIWGSVMSLKCPHCSAKPPNVKLDSNTKVMMETRNEKNQVKKVLHTSKKGYESESEESENEDEKNNDGDKNAKEKKQSYVNPLEVKEHLKLLWENDKKLLNLIFGNLIVNQKTLQTLKKGYKILANDWETFFIEALPVTPNKFRPENKMADQTYLHEHTVVLTKAVQTNLDIKNLLVKSSDKDKDKEKDKKKEQKPQNEERTELTDTIRLWIQLQDNVNCFIDSSKALKLKEKELSGIRQLLERKEGLFRMKMMGKRVNYSARSVISPDPYINTNEVGVPMYVAKTLTFPESVNEYNIEKLRKLVLNGAYKWPGANYLEENGVKIALDTRNEAQRQALSKMLLHNYRNKVVYRHLMSGDVLLFNRQPTLHKASIMSHIARVLPKENTIRNHYANCKTYNADFDGDEMNLHLLQNHLARSEAYTISNTANQYISATTGKPLRGLIQDSVVSAFFLTNRGTLLTKDEYMQLVYIATWNVIAQKGRGKIIILKPTILKPKPMWTGKQVISSIIKTIVGAHNEAFLEDNLGLNINAKAKVNFGDITKKKVVVEDPVSKTTKTKDQIDIAAAQESEVIIRDNELLQGVVDANQIGSAEFGLVHSFYELYGGQMTETLITCLARVFTCYMQLHGFTCSMDDLVMNETYNVERRRLLEDALKLGVEAAAKYAGVDAELPEEMDLNYRPYFKLNSKGVYDSRVLKKQPDVNYISPDNKIAHGLRKKLVLEKNAYKDLDNAIKAVMGKQTSSINSTCVPAGLYKSFRTNFFSTIILTGAKGSNVNQHQVSSLLGQQELEGRRVPVLPSGKTLPSFIPYDPNPRSWGYITDRFLSGVRCQDFYFHCMAGREGLIDTAVKTSVSGYLQRCLIKNMEPVAVQYDFTVRDGDGSVVQFYYGEDALDPTKTKYLTNFDFLYKNFKGYIEKYNPSALASKVNQTAVKKFLTDRSKNPQEAGLDTIMNNYLPGSYFGAISESVLEKLNTYLNDKFQANNDDDLTKKKFRTLVSVKYFNSLMHPGESVGVLAGQAVGEPSTQMTLNTFHLAGHGGANVTLGIPRLREILFRGSGRVKTPMMTLTLAAEEGRDLTRRDAEFLTRKLQRLKLSELVQSIKVSEEKFLVRDGQILSETERARLYKIEIKFEDIKAIKYAFDLSFTTIKNRIEKLFMQNLITKVGKELKKSKHRGSEVVVQKVKEADETKRASVDKPDAADSDSDVEEDAEEATKSKKKKGGKTDKKDGEEEDANQYGQYYKNLTYSKAGNHHSVHIVLRVPLDAKKLLMLNIVENAISEVCVSSIPGINNCFLTTESKEVNGAKKEVFKIITEGLNFPAMFNFNFIDKNSMGCNDISEILNIYGVEAARRSIINEVVRVFKPYGINVDSRHLSLIADLMTYDGKIRTLTSRGVIKDSISPIQKMSFEMASRFLTEAAIANEYDALKSASSQIVLGRAPMIGSGMFEIHHKLEEEQHSDDEDMEVEEA